MEQKLTGSVSQTKRKVVHVKEMEEPATASAVTGSFKDQVSMRSIWLLSRNITNTSVTIPGLLLPSLVGTVCQEILLTELMIKLLL